MHWLLILTALIAPFQPQPRPTEQPPVSEQSLKAFGLYSAMVSVDPRLAGGHIDEGWMLLYYRAAHFVHDYAKATPADAINAAANVVQVPEIKALGDRLNVHPPEVEKRDGANVSDDREWVIDRTSTLMMRENLGLVELLITDTDLPLAGRVRFDILSEKDREEQIAIRFAALVTALQSFRKSSANLAELSDEDSTAALKLAQEQFAQDYMRINGYFVRVRGQWAACAPLEVDGVPSSLSDFSTLFA